MGGVGISGFSQRAPVGVCHSCFPGSESKEDGRRTGDSPLACISRKAVGWGTDWVAREHVGTCDLAGNDTERMRTLFADIKTWERQPFRPPLWDDRTVARVVGFLFTAESRHSPTPRRNTFSSTCHERCEQYSRRETLQRRIYYGTRTHR